MKGNFEHCFDFVVDLEGAETNHPEDGAGFVKYGISAKTFPKIDFKNFTRESAKKIYLDYFWNAIKGDELCGGYDLALFEGAVNLGVPKAVKAMQHVLQVKKDGIVGEETLRATQNQHFMQCILGYYTQRIHIYSSFNQKIFLDGWVFRCLKSCYFITMEA